MAGTGGFSDCDLMLFLAADRIVLVTQSADEKFYGKETPVIFKDTGSDQQPSLPARREGLEAQRSKAPASPCFGAGACLNWHCFILGVLLRSGEMLRVFFTYLGSCLFVLPDTLPGFAHSDGYRFLRLMLHKPGSGPRKAADAPVIDGLVRSPWNAASDQYSH